MVCVIEGMTGMSDWPRPPKLGRSLVVLIVDLGNASAGCAYPRTLGLWVSLR